MAEMAMLALSLIGLLGAGAPPAPETSFAPLDFLVGHCWRATLADGTATDTHCFEGLYAPHFLRDIHVVCAGGKRVYAGETTYSRAPDTRRIVWRYLSSAGLVIDGQLEPAGAALRFLGSYAGPNGGQVMRATWTPGQQRYRAVTEAGQPDGGWQLQSDLEFTLISGTPVCATE